MNTFVLTIEYFVTITMELTVLFLGISAAVALALMYIPQERISAWMANRGVFGNFMAATVGALTPFCACSTIPVTLGMLNAGVPFGHVMSFVIASPLLNPIIIGMVATLMGLEACLIYFSVTFFGSILFGVLLDKVGGARYVKNVRAKQSCCGSNENAIPLSFSGKIKAASKSAWGDFRSVPGLSACGRRHWRGYLRLYARRICGSSRWP